MAGELKIALDVEPLKEEIISDVLKAVRPAAEKPVLIEDVAEHFGKTVRTIRNWIKSGTFPKGKKVGNDILFYWSDIKEFLKKE